MLLYQAIVLAIIQGLTEFLPVSSTAHLVLFPWLLGWPDGGLAFDVALHVGTLIAVLLYFMKDWVELTLAGVGVHYPAGASAEKIAFHKRLFWLLVIGTIPGAIAGVLFERVIEDKLRFPVPIAIALILVGVLMWLAERHPRLTRHLEDANTGDAVTIGVAQAAALFPGVSRSGITIITGLFRGMRRETAARFSFLLSTPIIAGAALKEVPKLLKMSHSGQLDIPVSTIIIGIVVSGLVGYAVIAFFLHYLQTRTLKIFAYYRILFGIVILTLAFLHLGFAR
jgi:undecaprenyl-diphosphatase